MIHCPSCHDHKIKKNGYTYYGKQNFKCTTCQRLFVLDNQHTVDETRREIARRAAIHLVHRHNFYVNGVKHTWHHHQDGVTMFLVPSDIHSVAHTGGGSMMKYGLKGAFQGPQF